MQLRMNLSAFIAGLLLAVSSTVSGSPSPSLSFIEREGNVHLWKIWDADSNKTSSLLTSTTRPDHMFWRAGRREVFYTLGSRIYRLRWATTSSRPEEIANLPAKPESTRAIWLDQQSKRIRIATMTAVKDKDIVRKGGKVYYRLPDGTQIPELTVPSWGAIYIASVLELTPSGWELVARRSTRDDAGETPGVSVLDVFRNEDGMSNARILEAYSCASGVCRNDVPEPLRSKASQVIARQLDPDAIGMIPDAANRPALIFATTSGDTLHMVPPIFVVDMKDKVRLLPTSHHGEIAIALRRNLVLVSEEGSGKNPVVFDSTSGQQVFSSRGANATWIP